MFKFILIAMFLSGLPVVADNAATSPISVKSFTIQNGQAALNVRANGTDVALTGPMDQTPQLQDSSGRLLATCAAIGALALECDIGYDGSSGQLAVFKKKDGANYLLASSHVVLTNGGDDLNNLVQVQNSRGFSAEATTASLLRASATANTIYNLITALQAEPPANQAQPSEAPLPPSGHAPPQGGPPQGGVPGGYTGGGVYAGGVAPPMGRPPVVIAPPGVFIPPPGSHGVHTRHEEHHSSDTVLDSYDDEVSVPIVQMTSSSVDCIDGRCGFGPGPGVFPPCGGCGGPPAILPVPAPCPYYPGAPPCGGAGLFPPPYPVQPIYPVQPGYPVQPIYPPVVVGRSTYIGPPIRGPMGPMVGPRPMPYGGVRPMPPPQVRR